MGEFECGWEYKNYEDVTPNNLLHKLAGLDGLENEDILDQQPNISLKEALEVKPKLFFLALQDDSLKITNILSDSNYDSLWARGTEEAKTQGGFWSIFDGSGRFIDGNVVSR